MKMTSDKSSPFYAPNRSEAVIIVLLAIAVDILFDYIGDPDRGTLAVASSVGILSSVRMSVPLWKTRWFWVLIMVLSIFHVLFIMFVRIPGADNWDGFVFMPIAFADIVFTMGWIYLIFRIIHGPAERLFRERTD